MEADESLCMHHRQKGKVVGITGRSLHRQAMPGSPAAAPYLLKPSPPSLLPSHPPPSCILSSASQDRPCPEMAARPSPSFLPPSIPRPLNSAVASTSQLLPSWSLFPWCLCSCRGGREWWVPRWASAFRGLSTLFLFAQASSLLPTWAFRTRLPLRIFPIFRRMFVYSERLAALGLIFRWERGDRRVFGTTCSIFVTSNISFISQGTLPASWSAQLVPFSSTGSS